MDEKKLKPETLALRGGQALDPATGSRAVPIRRTTSDQFRNTDHAAASASGRAMAKA